MRDELDILEDKIKDIKRRISEIRKRNGWEYNTKPLIKDSIDVEGKAKVIKTKNNAEMDALKAKLMGKKK
jgi:hypothetical protein